MASSLVIAMLVCFNFCTFVFTYKERYTIYFREGRTKVPVTVEMDLNEKVAFLNIINAESRRSETVSLHDYSTNMIAYKDSEKNSCYLEKMSDASVVYEHRLLKSLNNQVLLEQADVLYVEEPPLSRREVSNVAGMKILYFCGRTLKYLISDSPAQKKRRSRRSTRPRTGHVQKSYSHHEHRSENYARFGHETTSHDHQHGSSKVTFIDPVGWPFNNSQPSAFQLAAIRHLKRVNRDRNLRTIDKPVGGNLFYGSGVGNSGQINTKIHSGFPGHSDFEANGQFGLTHAGSFGHRIGHDGYVNGNARTYSDSRSIPLSQSNHHHGKYHTSQTYLPALQNQNNGHRIQAPGTQEFQFRPNAGESGLSGGNGANRYYNPNILHQQNPNTYTQRAVESGLSSQSRVELEKDKFHTGASSQGAFGIDNSQSQVQGSASRDGAFQAQAQSSSLFGSSRSHTQGSAAGAQSSALSELQNIGHSQTNTQLAYNSSKAEATALTSTHTGSISSQSHGGEQEGQASSHAKGPGETSSSARIRFNEQELSPFLGKAEASAQGGINDGQSRTQVIGDHKGSIYSAVAQGSYGQPDEHQGPIALALPGDSEQSYLSQTPLINVQNQPQHPSLAQTQTRGNRQPSLPNSHQPQFYPENLQQPYNLPSNIKLSENYAPVPSTANYFTAHHYPSIQNSANGQINSQNIPQVLLPKNVQNQPLHHFSGVAKDKRLTQRQPHPFVNKQQSQTYLPQDKISSIQQQRLPSQTYFSHDKSSSFQQPHLPAQIIHKMPTQTHLLPNAGFPKTVLQQITPKSIPAANGFRTRVVTSHVQDIGSFLPTPAIDVFNSRYKHQVFHRQQQQQHGYPANKPVYPVNSSQNPRVQLNQNMFIKTFPSHQLPPTNPTVKPDTQFAGKNSDQPSKCSSSCFQGYKIAKIVKICRIVSGCQN